MQSYAEQQLVSNSIFFFSNKLLFIEQFFFAKNMQVSTERHKHVFGEQKELKFELEPGTSYFYLFEVPVSVEWPKSFVRIVKYASDEKIRE